MCPHCGLNFLFPNLLQAHVTLTCHRNDVIKRKTNEQATKGPSDELLVSDTDGEERGESAKFHQQRDESLLSYSSLDGQNRRLSDSYVGPSAFRAFRVKEAYGLSAALAQPQQQHQRLLKSAAVRGLMASFARPRVLKISSDPESIAEHQKNEFRKKFQGNEHYLQRHLYRAGGGGEIPRRVRNSEKCEGALGRRDGENAETLDKTSDDLWPRRTTMARDSTAKYGPFYSSDDYRLALRRKAESLSRASGCSKLSQPQEFTSEAKQGSCSRLLPGKYQAIPGRDSSRMLRNDYDRAEGKGRFPITDGARAEERGFHGNDQEGRVRENTLLRNDHVADEGEVRDAACTCGSHDNESFLGNSDDDGEAGHIKCEANSDSPPPTITGASTEQHSDGSASDSERYSSNPPSHRVNTQAFLRRNESLRLETYYATSSTLLHHKPPVLGSYCISPEPALLLEPLYYYSTHQRMLQRTLPQSPARPQARGQGFRCDYCGKEYCRKYVLKIHMRTHTGFKPLQCKVCDKSFSDPSNMKKHVKLHEAEDSGHECAHCGRSFVRYRGLLSHLKSKHPQTPHL